MLFVIVEDPNDPVWSMFACFHRIVTQHLPPGYQGHLFSKHDPEKVLRIRRKAGDSTEAHWGPVKDNKSGIKAAGNLAKISQLKCFAHFCASVRLCQC
jgi:hypothetical protein